MYPVPPGADTRGLTECQIGTWLARRSQRDRVIIATKVTGPSDWMHYLRGGKLHHDRANIEVAVEQSLQRLQADYIDIYQLHWPERNTSHFGELGPAPSDEQYKIPNDNGIKRRSEP
jgi:aryl-alcohol dehydrogenase-like predicted oxidoreductase